MASEQAISICGCINPYDFLGVTSKSTLEEVKKNYISLALLMHPDKGGSTTEMHILNMAYKWIREQLLIVENIDYKDYDSIQAAFDNFIKTQDESKPSQPSQSSLIHIYGDLIGFDYLTFCNLYNILRP
jgi:curved DNA-binding protein CbpA